MRVVCVLVICKYPYSMYLVSYAAHDPLVAAWCIYEIYIYVMCLMVYYISFLIYPWVESD